LLGVRILISGGILKLFGGAIIAVMLLLILRRESPDIALTAKMCAGVVLSLVCVASMSPIVEYIAEIGEGFGVGESLSQAVEVLLKALGISILAHLTANVCRDAGEGSIAYYVELGAKIEILILSLPLLSELLDLARELLEIS